MGSTAPVLRRVTSRDEFPSYGLSSLSLPLWLLCFFSPYPSPPPTLCIIPPPPAFIPRFTRSLFPVGLLPVCLSLSIAPCTLFSCRCIAVYPPPDSGCIICLLCIVYHPTPDVFLSGNVLQYAKCQLYAHALKRHSSQSPHANIATPPARYDLCSLSALHMPITS
ncbi:hypothetical protein VTO73DRAFT_178 [Trametes versicolor]